MAHKFARYTPSWLPQCLYGNYSRCCIFSAIRCRSYSEYADGVAYRRLIALASLSMAISGGKLLERINISLDASGENITAAVWDKAATLDLAGDMTSRVVAGQDAVADSANYPLASVTGSYAT